MILSRRFPINGKKIDIKVNQIYKEKYADKYQTMKKCDQSFKIRSKRCVHIFNKTNRSMSMNKNIE